MNARRAPSLSQEFGVMGCPDSCLKSHLEPTAVRRLISLGISPDLVRECLEFELTSHSPPGPSNVLTSSGRRNLRSYGATPDEIKLIEGSQRQEEPIRLDYHARERQRVANYRAGLDPETKRARDREYARKYREKLKQQELGGESS